MICRHVFPCIRFGNSCITTAELCAIFRQGFVDHVVNGRKIQCVDLLWFNSDSLNDLLQCLPIRAGSWPCFHSSNKTDNTFSALKIDEISFCEGTIGTECVIIGTSVRTRMPYSAFRNECNLIVGLKSTWNKFVFSKVANSWNQTNLYCQGSHRFAIHYFSIGQLFIGA